MRWQANIVAWECEEVANKKKHARGNVRSKVASKDSNHKLKRWRKAHLGGHDTVRRVDPNGEALVLCRKCSGYARCRLGAEADEPLQTRKESHERVREHV